MNTPTTRVSAAPARVRPVHDRCRGRVRLEIDGLYRAPILKHRLERLLLDLEGVRAAEANPVTGRVLVLFGTGLSIAELGKVIESELGSVPATALVHHPEHPRRWAVFDALNDWARSLRAFIGAWSATPVAAAVGATLAPGSPRVRHIQPIRPWFVMDLERVLAELGVSADHGLTGDQAGDRLRRFGENRLAAAERRSDIAIFVGQFNSLPVWLLGASAGVAVATGGLLDAGVILGVVLINSVIGFVTERQAERTIASLTESGAREVKLLRGGEAVMVPVEQVVPGDVMLLSPGTYVAADVRLLRANRLSVDESALTGESMPVTKDADFKTSDDTALGDRRNMAYMGTHVTGGNGRGLVVATAEATELGQIQTMVGEAEAPETPMQRQLGHMGTQLALLSGGVCIGVFGIGVLRGYAWLEMLKASVSLAVAAVPEGLPAVATTTLAMGIGEMRRRNVAVRHLDAVETLGSVQVFCMDKTGTLTLNRMAVVAVHCDGQAFALSEHRLLANGKTVDPLGRDALVRLMQVVSLNSEVELKGVPGAWTYEGSPTESALVELAVEAGIDVNALRAESPRIKTRYRAEGRPYMCTLHPYGESHLLAVKGSPDEVLAMCATQLVDGKRVDLSEQARTLIANENQRMAGNALRVLGVAYLEQDVAEVPDEPAGLCWLGLSGMADPMRTGMDGLIAEYHRAGIETIMITGDQAATASAIGRQLGLAGDKPLQVLESGHLDEMDPDLLAGLVRNVHVFARVSPAHKLKIVRALQEAGLVVAMTGDGINDGPALKAADIGVAMGKTGTNVAREVSDVVLEDDNLHTMTVAIGQGRTIYNNIRKMIHFMVSTNLTEIEVMLAGVILGWGETMNPMQLLWINLVTDIFPGLALSMEPAEPDIMTRRPRDPEEPIIARKDLKRMAFESGTIGLGTMGAFIYGMRRYGLGPAASTMAFNTLTLNELAHALSSRSHYRNLGGPLVGAEKLRPNKHLTRAVLGMTALQAVVSLVPGARRLLGTTPLGPLDLAAIGAGVLLPLLINEGTKPTWKGSPAEAEALAAAEHHRPEGIDPFAGPGVETEPRQQA